LDWPDDDNTIASTHKESCILGAVKSDRGVARVERETALETADAALKRKRK